MRYLVDTDFVIDHLTGQQDAHDTLAQLLPHGVAFTTFVSGVPVLPISRSVAKRTARLRLELRQHGRPITHRALDLVIAATALEHHLVLVTRNTKDYEDIPDLTLL